MEYTRARENMPGSQPTEMIPIFPPALAAASTLAKCSGTRAWVSKESTTLKRRAYFGVCSGRSVALPPQRIITSSLSAQPSASAAATTGTPGV